MAAAASNRARSLRRASARLPARGRLGSSMRHRTRRPPLLSSSLLNGAALRMLTGATFRLDDARAEERRTRTSVSPSAVQRPLKETDRWRTALDHVSGSRPPRSRSSYRDILQVWHEADAIPEIEHAWLFDHLMPIFGDPTGRSRGLDPAVGPGRRDPATAPRPAGDQQPVPAACDAGQDRRHGRYRLRRSARFRHRRRLPTEYPIAGANTRPTGFRTTTPPTRWAA